LFLLIIGNLNAQEYLQWINRTNNFKEIQRTAENYYKDRSQGRGSGFKQYKRWEYLVQDRLGPNGEVINYNRMVWDVVRDLPRKMKEHYGDNPEGCQSSWSLLAPHDGYVVAPKGYNPGLGRVNVVAFHPFDPDVVFAGTPAGGLWKTIDQGGSWIPLTDHLPSIGVSGIAIHPQNPDLIYILTGDGDGADTYSIGVLKSPDGGANWEETGLKFSVSQTRRGYKLVMSPDNPNVMMAAMSNGIYRSADAGATWGLVKEGNFVDIEFKPGNPSVVYAHTTNTFYRSLNNGFSWTVVSSGLPGGETRVAIAVSPANPEFVYLFAGPSEEDGFFKGLYRSTNGGTSFELQTDFPNLLGYPIDGMDDSDQSWYDLAIAADPDDAETVITGGINVWRSTDGGFTCQISSYWYYPDVAPFGLQYTHADIHDLVYSPVDGSLWCGSDGGVFRSPDDGLTWEDRSSVGAPGLSIMQFYRIAGYPGDPDIIIGGTQDNGSNRWEGGSDIVHFDGADGMDCMIHPQDPMVQYHTRQNGSLRKSFDGGANHFGIRPGSSGGYWVTPLAMDPYDPEVIYAAYADTVYRSTNGGEIWTGFIPQLEVGKYRSLHISPANTGRIYAATDQRIFTSNDTCATWTEITAGLPVSDQSRITMIATDADDENAVWVTLSGFVNGRKVFFSSNAGGGWENVTGSLPNLPVNCILYDPSEPGGDRSVYIGTDVGVYFRDATLGDWIPFYTGMPNVPVFDLDIHAATGTLRAGTFGRGIWASPLYEPDETAPGLSCPTAQTASFGAGCAFVLPHFGNLAAVSDNCDPSPEILQEPEAGTAIYSDTVITLSAVDFEGNESDPCTFLLVLTDTEGPAMECPGSVQANTCDGVGEYLVSWTDDCTEAEGGLTEGLPSGEVFPLGATTVTWTASDGNGNVSECSFPVVRADSMQFSVDAVEDETNSQANGAISVSVSGGAGPLQFSWMLDGEVISGEEDPVGLSAGSYFLEIADATGCTLAFGPVMVDNIVSVSEIPLEKDFGIYPNPARDVFWIEWEGSSAGQIEYELIDARGIAQMKGELEKSRQKITVRDLAPGVYTVRLSGQGWRVSKELVIL